MMKRYYVYILTNTRHTVLYVGITNDIAQRVYQHKEGRGSSFTTRYNVTLVYCETYEDVRDALTREKQLEAGSRQKKLELINTLNPDWRDLYDEL